MHPAQILAVKQEVLRADTRKLALGAASAAGAKCQPRDGWRRQKHLNCYIFNSCLRLI